jgi:hypothetical protein
MTTAKNPICSQYGLIQTSFSNLIKTYTVKAELFHTEDNMAVRFLKNDHFIFFIASGVGLSPLYCGHFWPIVPKELSYYKV